MTWHQWHHTADIESRMGRSSLPASAKASSDHPRHLISCARLGRGEKWNSGLPTWWGGPAACGRGGGSPMAPRLRNNERVISTSAVDAYIEKNSRRFIEELEELCAFPSISNHGLEAVKPARSWIAERLGRFTDRVETFDEGGMPALYAGGPGAGRRKLLLYQHYDVQPVDPIELWDSDPFQPVEKDGRIVARGVADDKADIMARIHALETLKGLGEMPVTLRFLVEGEEEIGSKTFEKIAHKHADKLRADGCLWESGASFDEAGRPTLQFGCRGLLYVQLRVKLLTYDQHSGLASIYPSAAMYLAEPLASLRDQDMNIRTDAFYHPLLQPPPPPRPLFPTI